MNGTDFVSNGILLDVWGKSYTDPVVLSVEELDLQRRLEAHVATLAGTIGTRNNRRPDALEAAALYIEREFRKAGYEPRRQEVRASDGSVSRNIEASAEGSGPNDTLVIGAHYDTVDLCPGANDNGSGVASLLEIAAAVARRKDNPRNAVRFVAFANEEPPYFGGPDMGSRMYAQELKRKHEPVMGMICLETLGYYSAEPGSLDPGDRLPDMLKAVYRNDVGNFVLICGNSESKAFVKSFLKAFRSGCDFPSEGLACPEEAVPGLSLSDHRNFWALGFKALMVTDTVYVRYGEHYHQTTDTPDRLNYPAFAKVTAGLAEAVWRLADEG
ncbi:MAG: M28 family peptidase [Pseudomonadota bacterium]